MTGLKHYLWIPEVLSSKAPLQGPSSCVPHSNTANISATSDLNYCRCVSKQD